MGDRDVYRELIDNLYEGVYFVDRERRITYWNKGAERITGYDGDRVLGRCCGDDLLNHVASDGRELCGDGCPLLACMSDGQTREAEVFLHHADGHRVPVLVRAAPMRDDHGEIVGAVESFSSAERLVAAREKVRQLRQVTRTDDLTGIRNRVHLEGCLVAAIAQAEAGTAAPAVLFADLDRFKDVNDRHGHDVGDRVLRMVATTLQQNLRDTDVVGRWGGEEFAAVLHDIPSDDVLREVTGQLRSLVASCGLDLDGGRLRVTVSIGATRVRPDDDPESVLRRADRLMYRSKQEGRDRVTVG